MGRYELDEDRAFAFLTRVSQDSNTKLRDIAARLVQTTNEDNHRPTQTSSKRRRQPKPGRHRRQQPCGPSSRRLTHASAPTPATRAGRGLPGTPAGGHIAQQHRKVNGQHFVVPAPTKPSPAPRLMSLLILHRLTLRWTDAHPGRDALPQGRARGSMPSRQVRVLPDDPNAPTGSREA